MDTKWKNRKRAFSFIIFFLGVSLTLGGLTGLIKDKSGGKRIWHPGKILENDYQESGRFRDYIENRLETLLIMAAGGVPYRTWEFDSGYYYGGDYGILSEGGYGYEYGGEFDYFYKEAEWEGYSEREAQESAYNSSAENDGSVGNQLTEEDIKEIAQKYHDAIKGDKNLLYSVSYDGEVLYANSDALNSDIGLDALGGKPTEGTPLEDYNFFLYFDGEKVRIVKDGREADVYGDGYYRAENGSGEGSWWYVPGYSNFPTDEAMKKARVFLAAAKEPVIYSEGVYGFRQFDNTLYWLHYECSAKQKALFREAVCLTVGAGLLLLGFLCRKSRREALLAIAGFQAKIWVEGKALLVLLMLCAASFIAIKSNYGYGIWEEIVIAYDYEPGMEAVSALSREMIRNLPPVFYIVIFWTVYFIWNDVRHNKKIWRHGLTAKLCRAFTVKNLSRPLSRKMAKRNAVVFIGAVVYEALITVFVIWGKTASGSASVWISRNAVLWITFVLTVAGAVILAMLAYFTGRKNMETARDLEVLALNISEIRKGNYTDMGKDFSGHDLEDMMAQLEDIRHGIAKAVDEQMKSERMKVELIANVSHDIKTPLTSIISYVQFLKQEEGLPDHVKDYIKILDEKSQRLKNMVQDVFAVSKAASGELPMHMEELDFGKLLRQTMADMGEEIGKSAVAFRTEIPESAVMIMADGQRMYRVFQNLFQNAIKYSLDGSRVYVTLKTDGELAVASVKNTSHLELDKGKDFTERFIRGDESRTDGGSGLGLSIAQSFTEACGGKFSFETDADLFIVKVSFKTLHNTI